MDTEQKKIKINPFISANGLIMLQKLHIYVHVETIRIRKGYCQLSKVTATSVLTEVCPEGNDKQHCVPNSRANCPLARLSVAAVVINSRVR